MVDTLGSCLFNCKLSLDETIRIIDNVSVAIQGDLVDGLDSHEKTYLASNKALIKRGQEVWNKLQNDKAQLQHAKEEYIHQMNSYTHAKRKMEEKQAKKDRKMSDSFQSTVVAPVLQELEGVISPEQHDVLQAQAQANHLQAQAATGSDQLLRSPSMRNPYDSLGRSKQQAILASNNYEQVLQSYNESVAFFEQNYTPVLNKVQESDKEYADFIKSKMEGFSSLIMQFGQLIKKNGEDLNQNSKIINSQTDLEIFIETNKSPTPYVQRESFEVYDENVHGSKKWEPVDRQGSITSQGSESGSNPYSMQAMAATTASDGQSARDSEAGPDYRSPQHAVSDDQTGKSAEQQ